MRIGILSDTHGRVDRLRAALQALAARGVELIVHCGDVGGEGCVRLLGGCGVPVHMVAGNMDKDVARLADAAARCGVLFHWEVAQVPLGDGRLLAAVHGDDQRLLGELIRGGQFAYVCHGHTHRRRDERIGPVRVINGGALHNTSAPSVAVLDTASDELEFIEA